MVQINERFIGELWCLDADTMGCIAGGIAHAFYGSVPERIASEVRTRLPDRFLDVLDRFERGYELATSASRG